MRHDNTIDSEATRLSRDIESFIDARAAASFQNRAVVSTARCTGDLMRDLPAVQNLEVQLGCLIQLSGQSCLERDNIGDEKDKVLKRIGADAKQPNNVKNTGFIGIGCSSLSDRSIGGGGDGGTGGGARAP